MHVVVVCVWLCALCLWFVMQCTCLRSVSLIISICYFVICCCLQSELAKLQQYCARIKKRGDSAAAARAITVADVIDGIACVMPNDQLTALQFCEFMRLIAFWAGSSGCDVILQAGGIPVVFDCLRSWPCEKDVVTTACASSSFLTLYGSETVKSAMRSVPDCEALLIAAHKSKLDISQAATALERLGYNMHVEVCVCVCDSCCCVHAGVACQPSTSASGCCSI